MLGSEAIRLAFIVISDPAVQALHPKSVPVATNYVMGGQLRIKQDSGQLACGFASHVMGINNHSESRGLILVLC